MDRTRTPLADAARRALSRPSGARLLVDGLSPAGGPSPDEPGGLPTDPSTTAGVELVDRHGTPVLLCAVSAPLVGAARRGRCATLSLAGHDGLGRVSFRGQLVPAGRDVVEDREVELVELRLTKVLVGPDGPESDLPVPLAEYLAVHDAGLASYAESVLAHTNADHGAQLREYAARLAGVGADTSSEPAAHELVAAAWLQALDATGIDLGWVDVHGAHRVRVLFPRPARSCGDLGELLRGTLCGHD